MVIVGGYETFVSRMDLEGHPDQPEWLSHVNASVLKVKLATAIIGISSIHLLKTFINAEQLHRPGADGQTIDPHHLPALGDRRSPTPTGCWQHRSHDEARTGSSPHAAKQRAVVTRRPARRVQRARWHRCRDGATPKHAREQALEAGTSISAWTSGSGIAGDRLADRRSRP